MELECRFFATYREAVGRKELDWSADDDARVGDVLAALEAEYEGLEGRLIADGEIRPQLSVLRNGRDVAHQSGAATTLEEGDTLSVFPPVAGG
ncbi:ubiquitin-like small modifier protein 1 [Halovivax sp.]|uniref:ubiquitin-like small modifier protein 1 n=1 Tax=Halovivax sp. TaxID=1935978 RepID=UPI0025BCF81C|nr:ubiquitin-like small modifier protein 1 [Halovivax sp.]